MLPSQRMMRVVMVVLACLTVRSAAHDRARPVHGDTILVSQDEWVTLERANLEDESGTVLIQTMIFPPGEDRDTVLRQRRLECELTRDGHITSERLCVCDSVHSGLDEYGAEYTMTYFRGCDGIKLSQYLDQLKQDAESAVDFFVKGSNILQQVFAVMQEVINHCLVPTSFWDNFVVDQNRNVKMVGVGSVSRSYDEECKYWKSSSSVINQLGPKPYWEPKDTYFHPLSFPDLPTFIDVAPRHWYALLQSYTLVWGAVKQPDVGPVLKVKPEELDNWRSVDAFYLAKSVIPSQQAKTIPTWVPPLLELFACSPARWIRSEQRPDAMIRLLEVWIQKWAQPQDRPDYTRVRDALTPTTPSRNEEGDSESEPESIVMERRDFEAYLNQPLQPLPPAPAPVKSSIFNILKIRSAHSARPKNDAAVVKPARYLVPDEIFLLSDLAGVTTAASLRASVSMPPLSTALKPLADPEPLAEPVTPSFGLGQLPRNFLGQSNSMGNVGNHWASKVGALRISKLSQDPDLSQSINVNHVRDRGAAVAWNEELMKRKEEVMKRKEEAGQEDFGVKEQEEQEEDEAEEIE